MTQQNKLKGFFRGFGSAVMGMIMVATIVVAGGGSTAYAAPYTHPPYCGGSVQRKCLKPLVVTISDKCVKDGGKIDFKFFNPNNVDAPRTITVYLNGEEFFGDEDVAVPGSSTLSYGPLPDGEWRVVVSWQTRVFADKTMSFKCQL